MGFLISGILQIQVISVRQEIVGVFSGETWAIKKDLWILSVISLFWEDGGKEMSACEEVV